ncbi:MAG TPA: metallopeptidase TldD-related protein [Actinomycetota bacterium]|nr:metallopeptidase TldD-related protein [Actinomycetota bacterium]
MGAHGPPLTHDDARALAGVALETGAADGVEVVFVASTTGLTRFAGSEIIQNIVRAEAHAYVRAAVGDRVGTSGTSRLDADGMRAAAGAALVAARASRPDPHWPGLPRPDDVGRPRPAGRWDDATAAATPAQRAARVRDVLDASERESAAGVYETSTHAAAVVSSGGVDCFDAFTRCDLNCLVDVGDGTGWAEASSHAAASVDAAGAARRALGKARRGRGAADAAPGVYEVVLEPAAVKDLVEYCSYSGFGAKQVIDGESFLATRAGEVVAAPSVTIADDVAHPHAVGFAFDFEGVPRRRVAIVDGGRATQPVTDVRTARMLGLPLTGHSTGSTEFGPYPFNLVLEPGADSFDDLVAGVDDGLLVTRFHYVNILDRPSTLLTGMTRDGTFRIARGEVAGPVRNLRFAQSALAAFAAVTGVGRDVEGLGTEFAPFGSTVVPALRVGEFRFASATSH